MREPVTSPDLHLSAQLAAAAGGRRAAAASPPMRRPPKRSAEFTPPSAATHPCRQQQRRQRVAALPVRADGMTSGVQIGGMRPTSPKVHAAALRCRGGRELHLFLVAL